MPAVIRKVGGKFVVFSHAGKGGKVLGRHDSHDKAAAQQRAVNASLHEKGRI